MKHTAPPHRQWSSPVLAHPDVRAAVAWLSAALGFTEHVRIGEDHGDGERECALEDPAGHGWQFTQTLWDAAPERHGCETVIPWQRAGHADGR